MERFHRLPFLNLGNCLQRTVPVSFGTILRSYLMLMLGEVKDAILHGREKLSSTQSEGLSNQLSKDRRHFPTRRGKNPHCAYSPPLLVHTLMCYLINSMPENGCSLAQQSRGDLSNTLSMGRLKCMSSRRTSYELPK